MELSTYERLKLSVQFQILEKVTESPREKEKIRNYVEALNNGYSREYGWPPFEFSKEELSDQECSFAIDVVQVYYDLWCSWDRLKDKDGITKEDIEFPGFDYNHELEICMYAERFLLGKTGHHQGAIWPEWFNGSQKIPNTHFPTLDKYRRMIREWRSITKDMDPHPAEMKPNHIRAILDAGKPKKRGE